MHSLLEKISHYTHWLVFILLEVTSLVLLFRFNSYQGSVWFTQANAVAGTVLRWEADALAYLQFGQVNRQLVRQNLVLQYNNDVMRHQLAQYRQDSTLTTRAMTDVMQDINLIPAHVIDNSVMRRDNYITLDRGRLDGVYPEMGVVSGTGVVGIVYMASDHYSVVLPILHSRSSISCRLRDSEYFGYLRWDGGSPLRAYIDDIPRHARFQIGDVVETSGYSTVFPPGIFVGKVCRIQNSDDGLSFKLQVRLSTDLSCLRDVCVVAQTFHQELDSLQNSAIEHTPE